MAEVLHDAIVQVTQVPTTFDSIAFPGGDRQKTDAYPIGTRAVQLYYWLLLQCVSSDDPRLKEMTQKSPGGTTEK